MRRKEKEITSLEEIEEIVKKSKVCRIGLVDGDEPYILPVCFGYEGNSLYFHSAPEGRKIDLIRRNNRACFEIDTDVEIISGEKPCDWTARYRSVIGTGRAFILEKNEEKRHGLSVIMRQYSPNISELRFEKLGSVAVVKIEVDRITGKKSGC
jgi:nitroimidazol reductase NimA-like FMN-containing flavoprotein (pyridoxamine 5'-phosphate oxidase superfamily)